MAAILLLAGLVGLVVGAELLVRGASRLAIGWGISPLIVGLTVVAFGTSAPEGAVGVSAALAGNTDLALGNVIGSNQFNTLAVLGVAGIIGTLVVAQKLVRREMLLVIVLSGLVWLMALDGSIGRLDGLALFLGILAYTFWAVKSEKKGAEPAEVVEEYEQEIKGGGKWYVNLGMVAGGLVGLVFGAGWLVDGASRIAVNFGMPQSLVGVTIVAVGTSLPELATSVIAAVRGERDIAVGNVVGSSIFNLLGVLGLTALVAPSGVPVVGDVATFQLPALVFVSILAAGMFYTKLAVHRWEALSLLFLYALYVGYSVLAVSHDGPPPAFIAFSGAIVVLVSGAVAVTVAKEYLGGRRVVRSVDALSSDRPSRKNTDV